MSTSKQSNLWHALSFCTTTLEVTEKVQVLIKKDTTPPSDKHNNHCSMDITQVDLH